MASWEVQLINVYKVLQDHQKHKTDLKARVFNYCKEVHYLGHVFYLYTYLDNFSRSPLSIDAVLQGLRKVVLRSKVINLEKLIIALVSIKFGLVLLAKKKKNLTKISFEQLFSKYGPCTPGGSKTFLGGL